MNILSTFNITTPQYTPHFGAGKRIPRIVMKNQLTQDVVEISKKIPDLLPEKFTFTEFEETFNTILVKLNKLEWNIKTQKENLKIYYSPQDKYEYKELLKQRRCFKAQLSRLAKKEGLNENDVESDIMNKKQYNRLAPKVYRAADEKALNALQAEINSDSYLFIRVKEMLNILIEQRREIIRKH